MKYYMMVPVADHYKWLGRTFEDDGIVLANVRHLPVAKSWKPICVNWLSETEDRPLCDFPIFTAKVRCMSRRAAVTLQRYLTESIELLPLLGVPDYFGFHCIKWLEAADLSSVDVNRISIHSTAFVPTLKSSVISNHHIFGVPEMVAKIFVSAEVVAEVRNAQLTGLDFYEVQIS